MDSQQSKAEYCTKLIGKNVPLHLAKVFITPDMTSKERESNKTLRNKLSKLNKSGKNYQIKKKKQKDSVEEQLSCSGLTDNYLKKAEDVSGSNMPAVMCLFTNP